MPRTKTTLPAPTRQKGQRSLDDPLYIYRPFFTPWSNPSYLSSEMWRRVVEGQQICLLCRETLIGNLLSLDWKIEPRDSTQRDELKGEIDYYTKFFEYTGDYDYSQIIEWVVADLLDLPFGAGVELGRESDSDDGKLLWIELLDGGTLYPTLNRDWPVAQYIPEVTVNPIVFPKRAINRVYMSPRTEIKRRGWGMAPPEKIWIALNLLSKGDTYFANLLSDTPDAGILDLINMSKESAVEWVEGWKKLLTGIDAQKIPVLYEHDTAAEWIPFTRNPNDIQFAQAVDRYTSIVAAGYGMSSSDILAGGSQNGGNTMAGNLRDERKTKKNGYARLKRKMTAFMNRMLPPELTFRYIDMDDELMVSIGRARLANATAFNALVSGNSLTEEEVRAQIVADGMMTVSIPEKLPQELQEKIDLKKKSAEMFASGGPNTGNNKPGFGKNGPAERPSMLGKPVKPSLGGKGEAASNKSAVDTWIENVVYADPKYLQRLAFTVFPLVQADIEHVGDDDFEWLGKQNRSLWSGEVDESLPEISKILLSNTKDTLVQQLIGETWWKADLDAVISDLTQATDVYLEADRRTKELRSYVENIPIEKLEVDRSAVVAKVTENVTTGMSYVPEFIANAVLSGVRDYILLGGNINTYSVYDPALTEMMRDRLLVALRSMTDVFIPDTSGIIVA